jgi:hypothetical protein
MLLSHFTLHVCGYVSEAERALFSPEFIIKLSRSYPFLLFGIIALSALHLALYQVEGRQRQRLQNFAVDKVSAALPLYREALAKPTSESVTPVVIFSGYLVLYTLVSSRDSDIYALPTKSDSHWTYVLRGHRLLVARYQACLDNHLIASVFDRLMEHNILESDVTDNIFLLRLQEMFPQNLSWYPMTEPIVTSFPNSLPSDTLLNDDPRLEVCYTALYNLRAIASPPGPVIFTWLGDVSQEYMTLVEERFPQALLVFAGYCALLASLDHVWFLKGLGSGLLKSIEGELNGEWEAILSWIFDRGSDNIDRLGHEGEEQSDFYTVSY